MALKALSLIRGDYQPFNLCFKRVDGSPYCIKNWVVHLTVKSNYSLPDEQAAFQKIVTTFPDTISGTSGSAQIVVEPEDTINLEPGDYDYDIAVTTSEGRPFTVLRGKLVIEYDVTRITGTAGTTA